MKIIIALFLLLECFAHVGAEDDGDDSSLEVAAGSSVELNGQALLERMRLRKSLQHQDAAGTTSESFTPDLTSEGGSTGASRAQSVQPGDGRAVRALGSFHSPTLTTEICVHSLYRPSGCVLSFGSTVGPFSAFRKRQQQRSRASRCITHITQPAGK
jgi:hypothetical protein